jgi:hypothetical protein
MFLRDECSSWQVTEALRLISEWQSVTARNTSFEVKWHPWRWPDMSHWPRSKEAMIRPMWDITRPIIITDYGMAFLRCSIHPALSKTSLFSRWSVLFFPSSFIHSPLSTFTLLYTEILTSGQVVTLLRKRTGGGGGGDREEKGEPEGEGKKVRGKENQHQE